MADSRDLSPPLAGMTFPAFGWVLYGLGARAISGVVFMLGPLLLIDAARAADEADEGETILFGIVSLPRFIPTSIPPITITLGLLAQCFAAPLLASLADRHGARRLIMTAHVILGLGACFLLGLDLKWSVFAQASLVGTLYYAMALAWMFQNALLPSVAPVARRPTLSLWSTAVSNLGGAAFLILQYRILSADHPADMLRLNPFLAHTQSGAPSNGQPRVLPVGTSASAVVAAAAAHAPSVGEIHFMCLLAAVWWLLSALPALGLMALLKSEPAASLPPPPVSPPTAAPTRFGEVDVDQAKAVAHSWGKGTDAAGLAAAAEVASGAAGGVRPRRHGLGLLSGVRRLRRHKHASRFVLAQVLYLTAAVADGTAASPFAREVVGLDVTAIVRLTIFAALTGAVGSVVTMGLARCFGERQTLCALMCVPPLLLLYTSLVLESEDEFLVIGMIHGFVHGGVGFHGLNRGVFAQMVPRGHEAEFFGVYFLSIKAFSWVGPLACAILNEATGSLRTAILSALAFYIPAILVLGLSDFDEAKREAEAASLPPRTGSTPSGAAAAAHPDHTVLRAGPRERLLPLPSTYGTAAPCPAHSTSMGTHNLNMIGNMPIAHGALSTLLDALDRALQSGASPEETARRASDIAQHIGARRVSAATTRAIAAACCAIRQPTQYPAIIPAASAQGAERSTAIEWRNKIDAALWREARARPTVPPPPVYAGFTPLPIRDEGDAAAQTQQAAAAAPPPLPCASITPFGATAAALAGLPIALATPVGSGAAAGGPSGSQRPADEIGDVELVVATELARMAAPDKTPPSAPPSPPEGWGSIEDES